MLALGLADKMVGTAYLDDYIWPQYAADYAKIPVLSSSYPNETTIMSVSPDFILASYQSAFYEMYHDPKRGARGIFNTTVDACVGVGSEWGPDKKKTCRPQLHSKGISTYLMADACENSSLRPDAVSEQTVYEEMRALGSIFQVDVEPLIKEMEEDFDKASGMVSSANHGQKLKVAWLDCVGRCCKVDDGEEPEVFVGAGSGAPNLLMQEAGLDNMFKNVEGNWACVKESELISGAPDVIVVVDAAWDTAVSKLQWLYNQSELCDMDVLKGARFVQIPFSATTLGPRNGAAALDLAIAALHVRLGSITATRESGVGSFNPHELERHVEGTKCRIQKEKMMYDDAYPVSYTSCGIKHTVSESPTRAVTLNQGATEFMLALGLADKMVGTAYLDDYIWPQYAADYAKIPVLSSSYPNETTIMSVSPDFILASYQSAFYEMYHDPKRGARGIFNTTVDACVGVGSEWGPDKKKTCRPQLHSKGISTYLMADACENSSLRPDAVSEQTVYEEMRALGSIFQVDVEPLIKEMEEDFDKASGMVSSANHGQKLKVAWLDCVGRCCKVDDGEEPEVFVGAGSGAPNLLMQEAGLDNMFKNVEGNWACVKESELISGAPDVIVVVDAAWDTAVSKLQWLYNQSELCDMDVLKGARFVQIPFSATTLGPRNGAAALDLAIAALHVRLGSMTATRKSGVGSFNPHELEQHVQGSKCRIQKEQMVYDDSQKQTMGQEGNTGQSSTIATIATTDGPEFADQGHKLALGWPLVLALFASCVFASS